MKYTWRKFRSIARALTTCIASLILFTACSGGSGQTEAGVIKDEKTSSASKAPINYPREEDVRALVGDTKYDFPSDSQGVVSILERVLDGFQAAAPSLTGDDGYKIMWGFKYKEASLESVAILDKSGHLLLIGAVTNVVPLVHGRSNVVSSVREYQDKIKAVVKDPSDVTLFVDPSADLSKTISLFKRWLQADLMGFNAGCNDEHYRSACALLPYIEIPITVFKLNKIKSGSADGSYELQQVDLPDVSESDIPLEKFSQ